MQTSQTAAIQGIEAPAIDATSIRKAVTAATVGTIIEWYDYALYGAASGLIINKLFFPQLSPVAGVLAAFATFAVGFFTRPLGGLIISHFGDKFGRKPALIFTISLMGASTVAIGLLPDFNQIGVAAPVLLVLLRLLQGFGAGAEYAGAVTLVSEYVPPERRGYYTAYLQSATIIGILLATFSFLAISYVPEETLLSWAWRIPFLISALLFVVALYIRNRLDETPEYLVAVERAETHRREARVPVRELLRNSPKEVVLGFLSVTGHNANAYILNAFALSYMINTLKMPRTDSLVAVIVATAAGIVATPVLGAIADRVGHAKVYAFGAIFMVLFAFPLFALIDTKNAALATLGMGLAYALGFGGMAGAQGAFLANLFPTRYRFSGIAFARELNSLLIAGPTPFIASALVAMSDGTPRLVVFYLMICCALTVVSVWAVRGRAVNTGRLSK
ncbi:MAG TPA: MFS transporter [Stellaceae bacterium]|nr:MFS transporter [Stellaceae bacterium]